MEKMHQVKVFCQSKVDYRNNLPHESLEKTMCSWLSRESIRIVGIAQSECESNITTTVIFKNKRKGVCK